MLLCIVFLKILCIAFHLKSNFVSIITERAELGVSGGSRYPHLQSSLQSENLETRIIFASSNFCYLVRYPHLKLASALSTFLQSWVSGTHNLSLFLEFGFFTRILTNFLEISENNSKLNFSFNKMKIFLKIYKTSQYLIKSILFCS